MARAERFLNAPVPAATSSSAAGPRARVVVRAIVEVAFLLLAVVVAMRRSRGSFSGERILDLPFGEALPPSAERHKGRAAGAAGA